MGQGVEKRRGEQVKFMRNYRGSTGVAELIIKAVLVIIAIGVLVAVFKAIFAIIATLLTLAVIAIAIVLVIRVLGGNNSRRNRW